MRAMCNQGERATGGGGGFTDGGFGSTDLIYWSVPVDATGARATAGQAPMGWDMAYKNGGGVSRTFRTFVICASP
jgi:hypothetical protein